MAEKRRYLDTRDIDDLYRSEIISRDSFMDPRALWEEPELPRERVEKVRVRSVEAMPRLEDEEIEKLRRISPQIIGSLFDRVRFLKERIEETEKTIQSRAEINRKMIEEIDEDVREKQVMFNKAMSIDEQRSIKLDISVLRKEKRREIVQFWRDMYELRAELKELLEQFQNEEKLAGLFDEIRKRGGEDSE